MKFSSNSGHLPFVIIIGLASIQGLRAARIFAAHGIPALAMTDDPDHFCCRIRVCREIIVTETRGAGFIAELERRAGDFLKPPVLIPYHDETVLQLSQHRQRLKNKYRFLLPPAEEVESLMNKSCFYPLAEAHSGVVPQTRIVHNKSDFDCMLGSVPFPCVVKPPDRSITWSANTAFKAFKVDDSEALQRIYTQCRNLSESLIV